MRLLAAFAIALLLGLAGYADAAVTTTTVDCRVGADFLNKVRQATVDTDEDVIVIQVSPGRPVTVQFKSDGAWYYRTTTADTATQDDIAAGQVQKLRFTETTTFYVTRVSANSTLKITPLLVEGG